MNKFNIEHAQNKLNNKADGMDSTFPEHLSLSGYKKKADTMWSQK